MRGLRSLFSYNNDTKTVIEEIAAMVKTMPPAQHMRGSRKTGAEGSMVPKEWHRVYGEHTAQELIFMSYKEPTTYSTIKIIRDKKNRRGYEWIEEYAAVCPGCGREYSTLDEKLKEPPGGSPEEEIPVEGQPEEETPQGEVHYCEDCGSELEYPDPEEYEDAEKLLENPIQDRDQIHFSLLQNTHDRDVLTLGNGYYILIRDYPLDEDGAIVDTREEDGMDPDEHIWPKPVGIRVAPEEMVSKIEDDYGNVGGKKFVCLHCRATRKGYQPSEDPHYCPYCNRTVLYPVELIVSPHGQGQGDGTQYYIDGEYYWTPFTQDGIRFSMAPMEVLSDIIANKIFQYRYFLNIYKNKQSNTVLKWVRTKSINAFKQFLKWWKETWKNKEEGWIMSDAETGGQPAGAIKLDYTAQELDSLAYIENLDNAIAITFGVSPSGRGSAEAGSGLGNESKDITIETERIVAYQDVDNDGFYKWYAKDLWGIKGWQLQHKKPENEDEVRESERLLKIMDVAEKALNLGLTVDVAEGIEKFDIRLTGNFKSPEEMSSSQNPWDQQDQGAGEPPPGLFGQDDMVGGPDIENAPRRGRDELNH